MVEVDRQGHGGQDSTGAWSMVEQVDRQYLRLEGLEPLDLDSVHHDSTLQGNFKKSQLVLSINFVVRVSVFPMTTCITQSLSFEDADRRAVSAAWARSDNSFRST